MSKLESLHFSDQTTINAAKTSQKKKKEKKRASRLNAI